MKILIEYCKGITLFRLVEEFSLTDIVFNEIFLQMVDVVMFLHDNDIIHRDLKLNNFIILQKTGQLKLFDFDSSYLGPVGTVAISEEFTGTARFVSPEMI